MQKHFNIHLQGSPGLPSGDHRFSQRLSNRYCCWSILRNMKINQISTVKAVTSNHQNIIVWLSNTSLQHSVSPICLRCSVLHLEPTGNNPFTYWYTVVAMETNEGFVWKCKEWKKCSTIRDKKAYWWTNKVAPNYLPIYFKASLIVTVVRSVGRLLLNFFIYFVLYYVLI